MSLPQDRENPAPAKKKLDFGERIAGKQLTPGHVIFRIVAVITIALILGKLFGWY